jgi:hypothetical protein
LATARKSARCLSRSMKDLSGKPGSGAQTFAATRAASGEDLAAAGRGQSGAEAMTALAHQFAGLVSPLHGSFSADRAICLINEICPMMLAGPKRAIFRPKSSRPGRTGSSRTVGAAYTGATPFRQCCRQSGHGSSKRHNWPEYLSICGVLRTGIRARLQAGYIRPWTMLLPGPHSEVRARTGSGNGGVYLINLTASRSGRIVKRRGSESSYDFSDRPTADH